MLSLYAKNYKAGEIAWRKSTCLACVRAPLFDPQKCKKKLPRLV
jgi:hypothetical protein